MLAATVLRSRYYHELATWQVCPPRRLIPVVIRHPLTAVVGAFTEVASDSSWLSRPLASLSTSTDWVRSLAIFQHEVLVLYRDMFALQYEHVTPSDCVRPLPCHYE